MSTKQPEYHNRRVVYSRTLAQTMPALQREERDRVRTELQQQTEEINALIANGWHITKLDYVVEVDNGGFALVVDIEKAA